MRKLDLVRKKTEPTLKLEVDNSKQVEAIEAVKSSVDNLLRAVSDQEKPDFGPLANELAKIGEKLNLEGQFDNLVAEVRELGNKPDPEKADFTPVVKAVENIKIQAVNTSALGTQTTHMRGEAQNVIIPASNGRNNVYGLIIANLTDDKVNVYVRDGSILRTVIACPAKETRGFMAHPLGAIQQTLPNNAWVASCDRSSAEIQLTVNYIGG